MTMVLNLKPWPYLCLVVEMHSSIIVYSGKLLIANSIWKACISIHAHRESFFLIFSLSFFFLHFGAKLTEIRPMGKMLARAKQSNSPQVGAQCTHRLHQEEKPMLIVQLSPHNSNRTLSTDPDSHLTKSTAASS